MNKSELIDELAARMSGDKKAAAAAVEGFVDVVSRTVTKGERVAITGFGVFEKRDRNARTARNPRTGETIKVAKTTVPAFRPGQAFKDAVSGGAKPATKRAAGTAAAKKTAAKKTAAKKTAASTSKATAAKSSTTKATATKSAKKATAKSTAKSTAKKASAKKTAAKKSS